MVTTALTAYVNVLHLILVKTTTNASSAFFAKKANAKVGVMKRKSVFARRDFVVFVAFVGLYLKDIVPAMFIAPKVGVAAPKDVFPLAKPIGIARMGPPVENKGIV